MDEKLLAILGCPVDKEELDVVGEKLVCKQCGRSYQVKDGIPVMLVADYAVEKK